MTQFLLLAEWLILHLHTLYCVLLVLVGKLIVYCRANGFLTLLVLHYLMALVIYDKVEGVTQYSLVSTEVSVCGTYHTIACILGVLQWSNFKAEVLTVLYPVCHLWLTWCYDKDTSLALLHETLHDAESCVCLTSTRAIGEHHALAEAMCPVLMLLVEELHFSLIHIIPLFG